MRSVAYLRCRGGRNVLPKLARPFSRKAGCNIAAGGAGSCGGAGGAGAVSVYTVRAIFWRKAKSYLKIAVSRVKLRFSAVGRMCFFGKLIS